MPLYTQVPTQGPAPIEGDAESWLHGVQALSSADLRTMPAVTMIQDNEARGAGGTIVSHDDAVKKLTEQGYPSDMIGKQGITSGALDVIMRRQSDIAVNRSVASRANLG